MLKNEDIDKTVKEIIDITSTKQNKRNLKKRIWKFKSDLAKKSIKSKTKINLKNLIFVSLDCDKLNELREYLLNYVNLK